MAVALVGCGGGAGPKAAINGGVETTHTYAASAALNRAVQRAAINSAINAAQTAVRDLDLDSMDDAIAAAQAYIDAIAVAIEAGDDVPAHELADARAMRDGIQMDLDAREMANGKVNELTDNLATATAKVSELTDELGTATAKVDELNGELAMANSEKDDLQDKLTAANATVEDLTTKLGTATTERDSLQTQLTAANATVEDLTAKLGTATDKVDELNGELADANSMVATLTAARDDYKAKLDAANEELADLRQQMEEEKETAADKERLATAAKLFAAISPASGDLTTTADGDRAAQIDVSGTGGAPTISVNYGGGETGGTPNSVELGLDKDTPVADHRGWKGNRYVEKDDDGKVITEARVYSDENPTPGKPFDDEYSDNLSAEGVLDTATTEAAANRVASARFDQTAGVKEFKLPTNNIAVQIPGTYHGVSGTYSCRPADASTCAANVVADGFTLGGTADDNNAFTADGGTWTFKPTNAKATVMEGADGMYAVYGWWLRKPTADGAWTASAFASYYGTPETITALDTALSGSATYTGGAAGKYALSSTTGGTNEAGHFTARATLEADFNTEMITGTIDNFMGVGGAKDWSVALQKSGFSPAGQIRGADGANDSTPMKTVWTMDGTAATASGHWKGDFREVGATGVPKVVTGDFYTEFGNSGKMVGGFGAKTE